jgi:hypothetical protein
MINTFDVHLSTDQGLIVIEGIVLHESEGDGDHATVLAIELLRDDGITGAISPILIICH